MTPEQTLQMARFALDHAEDAAFCVDTEGHFQYVNEAMCRALGYSAPDLIGKTLFEVGPDLTPELWSQLWKEIKTRDVFAFEFILRTETQKSLSVEIAARYFPLPNQELLFGFFRDVSEHKRLQQLKNEFVSTVSHELRTPMTIIRESVSQLLDGLLGDMAPPQREALYVTLSGIDRLARIINDLLDVSKMEAGKASLKWDRLNLADLVREVLDTFALRAKERGLELYAALPAGPVIVYADYDRLAQVFTNLVANALKFSERGKIQITLAEHASAVECVVSDNGIGIPREDLSRIFNKFVQVGQPAVTGEKGSGLGLSICKGIIELHQGKIWADSQPGKGSTFTFTLPKRTAEELFRQKISAELALAAPTGGHVTAVVFRVTTRKKADPRQEATQSDWALDELVETIKSHGARRTDILLKDARAAWLGLLNMNKKEGLRIVRQIMEGYQVALEKNDLIDSVGVSVGLRSFPEEVKNEKDLMDPLIEESRDAA